MANESSNPYTKIKELEKELENIRNENKELKQQNERLKKPTNDKLNTQSNDFWINVQTACRSDPDYVKSLVANKTITMNDVNDSGRTLLLLATYCGSYELVQLCLNLGSDIKHRDNDNRTALDLSRYCSYVHIEQLLLFSEMNANIGNKVKQTSDQMNKQKGIIDNIMKQLKPYDDLAQQFFKDTLIVMMINIISNKLAFSDDILNLCLYIIKDDHTKDPLKSDLWQCITKTCQEIINNYSKRDWVWFKTFMLPSTIWFQNQEYDEEKQSGNDNKQSYLFYELLKWVEIESNNQLNELEQNLSTSTNKTNWNKLIKWDINTLSFRKYEQIRQDMIPNGISSRFSYYELSEYMGVSATFNTHKFYDFNEYLPQLILLSQIIDDEFQKSVQKIFNIDKKTKMGTIGDEKKENMNDVIEYMQGPCKLIERAQNKAENDYLNEEYPTTACILDFNRCSLIFNDISILLMALELFTNKVKYYQSGVIIGIVRFKNGFKDYVKKTKYADIKLNVLIKGKVNNLIGEVQFLLRTMKQFKDKAHNLYSIQRQQDYVSNNVSLILPNLLDENIQLFVAASMGNVNGICKLMAINNKTKKDIMKIDEESQESIIMSVIGLGNEKCFRFLKKIIDTKLFVKLLFLSNKHNLNCIEGAIAFARNVMIKDIFSMKHVEEIYKQNIDNEYRLMWWLFTFGDVDMIDFILSKLSVSNQDIIKYLNHKYTTKSIGHYQYHNLKIITGCAQRNTSMDSFKKLVSIIGEKLFIKYVFIADGYNKNAIEYCISGHRLEMIQYIMSFSQIKKQCISNQKILFRIVCCMNKQFQNKKTYNFMLNILKTLDSEIISTIKQLQKYQYPKPKNDEFDETAVKYYNQKITDDMLSKLSKAIIE